VIKILVLGSSGFFGKILVPYLRKKNYEVCTDIGYLKKKLKKNQNVQYELFKEIIKKKPKIIINLIAFTNIDKCEKFKKLAENSNSFFVKTLSTVISKFFLKNIHLIHLSTDQVYNGYGPHTEKNVSPKNYYAKTKLKGEKFASEINSTILRTNFIGKSKNKKASLSDWIVKNIKKKKSIFVFKNIFFSPLHTSTLCDAINKVIKLRIKGVYNLGSSSRISKAEFAKQLCKRLNLNLNKLVYTNYSNKFLFARRPLDMSLNVNKFKKKFKFKLPKVMTEIGKLSREYSKGKT